MFCLIDRFLGACSESVVLLWTLFFFWFSENKSSGWSGFFFLVNMFFVNLLVPCFSRLQCYCFLIGLFQCVGVYARSFPVSPSRVPWLVALCFFPSFGPLNFQAVCIWKVQQNDLNTIRQPISARSSPTVWLVNALMGDCPSGGIWMVRAGEGFCHFGMISKTNPHVGNVFDPTRFNKPGKSIHTTRLHIVDLK